MRTPENEAFDCPLAEWGRSATQSKTLLELLQIPLEDMTDGQKIDYFRWYGMMKWLQWESLEKFVRIAIIPNAERTQEQKEEWSIFTMMIDYAFCLEDAQMYVELEAIAEEKRTEEQKENYERLSHMIEIMNFIDESF